MVLFIPVYIDHCNISGQSNTVSLCYVVCYLSFIHSLSVVCILRNIKYPYFLETWLDYVIRPGLHWRLVARRQARHHKARLFCLGPAHTSHDSLLWYCATAILQRSCQLDDSVSSLRFSSIQTYQESDVIPIQRRWNGCLLPATPEEVNGFQRGIMQRWQVS
jgi:hypothetical protein